MYAQDDKLHIEGYLVCAHKVGYIYTDKEIFQLYDKAACNYLIKCVYTHDSIESL